MSTIIDIPSCTAFHLPTPNATALPLSTGELTVTVLPDQTLTLSIGTSSFPLTQRTKIQKVQTINQHPTYLFSPILPVSASGDASTAGERTIGQVKIVMKDSKNPGEWEATEALCKRFEEELKKHNVWDEKILFVNDEYELAGAGGEKSWGETFAGAIIGAGQAVAQKINTLTEGHVANTNPTHPPAPTDQQIGIAAVANARTASMAEAAENGATRLGNAIHEGGKKLGNQMPTAVHEKIHELNSGEKGELRKGLEEQWDNVKLVGQAIGDATLAVAGSASVNAHKAVEHNYGKAADKVAQDIGQTGANVGDTALSATKATSVIVQGANVSSGFGASTGSTEKTV